MIKRICILLLSLSLMATAVGCRRTPDTPSDADTTPSTQEAQETQADTAPSTEVESDTQPDTEPTTEGEPETAPAAEETTAPEIGSEADSEPVTEPDWQPPTPTSPTVVGSYLETLNIDGVPCFDATGNQNDHLNAADGLITIPDYAKSTALLVGGWIGFDRPIDCFGFSLDGDEPTFGNFALSTEDNIKIVGGEHARRFAIYIPLMELIPGGHTLELLVRLHDGTIVELCRPVTLYVGGFIADATLPYHASLTHVNSKAFSNCLGSLTDGMASANGSGISADANGRIKVSGWVATEGGVDRYVWSVDGIIWHEAESGGTTGEPTGISFAELGYENATANALFTNLILNLTPYNSQTVDVIVGAVPQNADKNVIPFATIREISIPDQIEDIAYPFQSDVNLHQEGDDLRTNTDLSDYFHIGYGAGDPHCVTNVEGKLCYELSGIHEMYATTDGSYALSCDVVSMSSTAFLFVRGYHSVLSDDLIANNDPSQGRFLLTNFYETDGAGAMGGAGIYASLHDGTLTVMLKYYNSANMTRVGNHITTLSCTGTTLTMADNGTGISIYVDGKLQVRILLSGEVTYPDISNVAPYGTFAATATISVAGGGVTTIQNTLVASSCLAQCGITVRGGGVCFSELSLLPLADAKLPK